jgi:poly(A) polymerase
MRTATLRRFLAEPQIADLLELVRIDALSASGDLSTWQFCQQRLQGLAADARRPEPFLRGRDLIELGHSPGPEFRRILEAAYDAQLEGEVRSNEEARTWAAVRFPSDLASRPAR